jgi:hypothetical protein
MTIPGGKPSRVAPPGGLGAAQFVKAVLVLTWFRGTDQQH